MTVREEDRDIWISRYLDGELPDEERREVEEKIRSDPVWAGELAAVRSLCGALDSALARIREQGMSDGFEDAVGSEIKRRGIRPARGITTRRRAGSLPLPSRRPLRAVFIPAAAAAAVALLVGSAVYVYIAGAGWLAGSGAPDNIFAVSAPPGTRATVNGRAEGPVPERLLPGQKLEVAVGTVALASPDGSHFRIRGPSAIEVEATADRRPSLTLREGFLLADVAPGKGEFRLGLPGGTTVRVLGTRFDVVAIRGDGKSADSIAVRVAEGRVAVEGSFGRVLATGGQAVLAKAGSAPAVIGFDARELIASWTAAPDRGEGGIEAYREPDIVPPWPQAGGAPSHSGATPLTGPDDLTVARTLSMPGTARGGGPVRTGATLVGMAMDAQGRCWAIERRGDISRLVRFDSSSGAVEEAGRFRGGSQCPPVLTPKGLCICSGSLPAESVVAFDIRIAPDGNRPGPCRIAWKRDVGASAYAVSVAGDGTVLVSAQNGLHALSEDGDPIWSAGGIGEIQAPASVDLEGCVYAAGVDGRVHCLNPADGRTIWTVRLSGGGRFFQPPVVGSSRVWTVDCSGTLSAIGRDGQVAGSRAFDGLKLCPIAARDGVLVAAGSKIFFVPEGSPTSAREVCDLREKGAPVAWAADGNRRLYAAASGGIARLDPDSNGGYQVAAWAQLAGDAAGWFPAISLSHGPLAIAAGRLAVLYSDRLLAWTAR
ncbi:MAG: PQQ-binding-like beta-propeller repeat protein [Planctomycetota bacterium]|nr:PQQ-binding-like beta-propeller repeat protein [Planctomycetota bacterium]